MVSLSQNSEIEVIQPHNVLCRFVLFVVFVGWLGGVSLAHGQEKREKQRTSSTKQWYPSILKGEDEAGANSPQGRYRYPPYLPNFSFVGYRWGEEPLPSSPGTVLSARDFGVIPDDGRDDTAALRRTFTEAESVSGPVTVRLPEGRVIVREILFIERGNFVLQGQGSGSEGTTLYVPRPLREMEVPDGYKDSPKRDFSPFSWEGGVMWTRDPQETESRELGRLVAGRRGGHLIETARPARVAPGDVVQIRWVNEDPESLFAHVYCTTDLEIGRKVNEIRQEVTVTEVSGRTVRVKEPLLHDVRRYWRPTLNSTDYLSGVGIEHLRIEFPDVPYEGHHDEAGYNAIYTTSLSHSWIRDVTIQNADSGILVERSKNLTVRGVKIAGRRGHYSIKLGPTYGTLVQNLVSTANDRHNPSVNTYSRYNVYTDVFVTNPRIDQHRGANLQNLFDDIEVIYYGRPKAGRLFQGSGSSLYKPRAGAFNTFWNVGVEFKESSGAGPIKVTEQAAAPHARIVGLHGNRPLEVEYGPEAYIEGLNRSGIAVPSLYEHQREHRLSGRMPPSVSLYRPLEGYRFDEDARIPLKAEVVGDGEVQSVKFIADGKNIGRDTEGSDGWSFTWKDPEPGRHRLRAVARTRAEREISSRPMSCNGQHPTIWVGEGDVVFKGNAPNPFQKRTVIRYTLRKAEHVQVSVFDVLGRRVRTLVDRVQGAGKKRVVLNGEGLASGTYFYSVATDSFQERGKATLIR